MESFTAGTPNNTSAPTPRSASASASAMRLGMVCCTTPGSDEMGWGASMPSRTNNGATRRLGCRRVSATSSRMAAVVRNRRGRCTGNGDAGMAVMVVHRTARCGEVGQ